MPTKKKRVGFIPRRDVLELISKLSYENNLSYSKIINILVEEALYTRGMFDRQSGKVFDEYRTNKEDIEINGKTEFVNKEFKNNFKNKLLKDDIQNIEEVEEEPLNKEIYAKFLLFLQFQERMEKRNL